MLIIILLATLKVGIEAGDKSLVSVSWYEEGSDEPLATASTGKDTYSYTIDDISSSNSYLCEINDGYNNYITLNFNVSVDNGFDAYAKNKDGSRTDEIIHHVNPNNSCDLIVYSEQSGTGNITYSWYDDTHAKSLLK